MPHVTFAIPGDIDLATGGYAYDRRVLALVPAAGVAAAHLQLPGGFPAPTVRDLADAEASLVRAGAADGAILMIDGLAYGALPADLIGRITAPIVALVHHPLCLEAGSSPARQDELRRLEIAALRMAARVICTSPTTARTLIADFDVPADKITVAEPGADPAARARGTASVDRAQPVQLLAVGSLIPRKGYDLLVEALFPLKSLAWRLAIAGSADLDAGTARDLRRQIEHRGLSDRISLLGAVDAARLAELYDRADLFVMSSHYEGYGMVLTEALASGSRSTIARARLRWRRASRRISPRKPACR